MIDPCHVMTHDLLRPQPIRRTSWKLHRVSKK